MDITESTAGDIRVAALNGRLDTATAPAVETRLLEMLAGGDRVVADLAAVTYVSSAGLRVLLKAAKMARISGGGFALASPQAAVREVLEISGFDKILEIHGSRDEAAGSFG
ncbi:STAS domain-containing protein [Roseomonas sp. AR75]|jgi:anti-anti-sigma factor|uniref:STAS domain-containing protein n=1 Tax=Roseomonas sp. AR75 TaxID=2562311 RepID=UPI0010BFB0D3|nr:STAS domain-containing protein [Roseomonas sp. AR75]